MRRVFSRYFITAVLPLFFVACNISDPGGGIEVECLEDAECPDGRCSNGICVNTGTNNDSGNSTTVDMGQPEDMSTADMAEVDMGQPDMGGPIECPDGFIDFNGDASDGCETVAFPGYDIESCRACGGAANAITGCGGGGECAIAACEEGFYDRDGRFENGCEANCAAGECWNIVTAEHSEYAFVDGPDFWLTSTPTGLIGRTASGDFSYHSLDGPRDYAAAPVANLHVVDEVIYGIRNGFLVRSVDHGRTFGRFSAAPDGTTIDISVGGDSRYYLLFSDGTCEARPCQDDTECGAADPFCSVAETACGSSKCSRPQDCGAGQHCSSDGVCIDDPDSCVACTTPNSCGGQIFTVYVTNDFNTFMPIGGEVPGTSPNYVHGSIDGYPIVSSSLGFGDDFRFDPTTNSWEPLDARNCGIKEMVFFASGDGVVLGDNCSFEYDSVEGKLNNRENYNANADTVLFHEGVIYVGGGNSISVSTNFGSGYNDRNVDGNVVHLYAETGNGVVALGSRGERWRSLDRGQSWAQEEEAFLPFPRQVETGSPLALVGLSTDNQVIAPANPTDPWLLIAPQGLARIKQANGAVFGFTNNSIRLYSSTDWQGLNAMAINNQNVSTAQWPACSGLPCRISSVAAISDGTYDGTTMAVAARVNMQVQPSPLVGWQNLPPQNAILRSPNGVSWSGVQYVGTVAPTYIGASDFGFVTDRGYSVDGASWFTGGTPTCGRGPFFNGPNGEIFGFGDNSVCSTDSGDQWTELASPFYVDENATVTSFHIVNGAFLATTQANDAVVLNTSADGASWNVVGPSWPTSTDLGFGTTNAAVAHPAFFGIAR